MRIIVVGGGKIGYYLTKTLMEHGHEAVLIEKSKSESELIANQLDTQIFCGDGTLSYVLEWAGAKTCDALISVTGQDESNLIACQTAKKVFGVSKVIARVTNPKNTSILKKLGVDVAVSTTAALAHIIEREADNAIIKELISLEDGEASISEIRITNKFKYLDKKLKDIDMPEQAIIATISRNGKLIVPNGFTRIMENDKILLVAHKDIMHTFSKFFV